MEHVPFTDDFPIKTSMFHGFSKFSLLQNSKHQPLGAFLCSAQLRSGFKTRKTHRPCSHAGAEPGNVDIGDPQLWVIFSGKNVEKLMINMDKIRQNLETILANFRDLTWFYMVLRCLRWQRCGFHQPKMPSKCLNGILAVKDLGTVEGKKSNCNGKWPFIVDFPIKNGDFPLLC